MAIKLVKVKIGEEEEKIGPLPIEISDEDVEEVIPKILELSNEERRKKLIEALPKRFSSA